MLPDDPDTRARLFYLVDAAAWGCWRSLSTARWHRLGRSLRDLAIWGLIIAMVVIAYGFRDTLRGQLFPAAMVETGAARSSSAARPTGISTPSWR